jgi:hypothetical protein
MEAKKTKGNNWGIGKKQKADVTARTELQLQRYNGAYWREY